jgi:hypothetical protein
VKKKESGESCFCRYKNKKRVNDMCWCEREMERWVE